MTHRPRPLLAAVRAWRDERVTLAGLMKIGAVSPSQVLTRLAAMDVALLDVLEAVERDVAEIRRTSISSEYRKGKSL